MLDALGQEILPDSKVLWGRSGNYAGFTFGTVVGMGKSTIHVRWTYDKHFDYNMNRTRYTSKTVRPENLVVVDKCLV